MNNSKKIVNSNEEIKNNTIKKDESNLKIQKIVNRVVLCLLFIPYGVFVCTIFVLYRYQSMQDVATTIDFVIASNSIFVLIVCNLKNRGIFKKKKYLWYSTIYIFLMTFGLIASMIAGILLQKAGEIARLLSIICLIITMLIELVDATRTDCDFYRDGEKKLEAKIEKDKKTSAMSFESKSSNSKLKK